MLKQRGTPLGEGCIPSENTLILGVSRRALFTLGMVATSFLLLSSQKSVSTPTEAYFTQRVVPVLEKGGCQNCHNADGVASGTRFRFPEEGATAEEMVLFGKSLHFLVDRTDPAKSLLVNKPTQRVGHAGGKKIAPGSPEEAVMRTWVDYLVRNTKPTDQFALGHRRHEARPVLRRLTNAQYNNTVRDLLGDDSRVADQFPAEDFVGGYRNQFQAQSVSPLLAESYGAAAEKVARSTFRGGDTRGLIPCKTADAACRAKFVKTFGAKAFRRPLLPAEVARYEKLFAGEKEFIAGTQLVVEAMLQSPNFLMRTENGAEPTWRPYETASRLSYALWNSMPDAELFRAAAQGELNDRAGVEKQARRMLTDQRAKATVDEFTSEWLRFDQLLDSVKERSSFPQYSPELAVSMTEETRRMVADLVWNNKDFTNFFSADYSYLSTALAKLYSVPAPKSEYERVVLPPETGRAGILGQAMFLAATSKPADTSATQRGLFVREHFLCQDVPQPPPGVNANLPNLDKARPMTNRERLAMHLNNESCASCHTLVDPIGLGFERYDAIGQYREKQKLVFKPTRENKKEEPTEVQLDIDTKGYVAGIPDSAFQTPRELGKILAVAPQCQECVVKQLFRYYMGRHESARDGSVIERAFADFRKSNFRFQELMVSLLTWSTYPPES